MTQPTLRDRKKERTRQALIDAATDLFESRGYDGTTVADIAAAADIGTRTFFSYFATKEELLFPRSDARIRAAVDAIADRGPGDRPADVLLRALHAVGEADDDMVSRLATLRTRLVRTVPAVQGYALRTQLDAQRQIARHLHAAYPDELTPVTAAALVGAFVGAISGAVQVLLDDAGDDASAARHPDDIRDQLRAATEAVLRPWLAAPE
ncbi:helix-turn-helix domain-containing protein [Longispora sp. K20-0274]|uniref:TetR/AcrR family transcriptional regulator n=1 Tax=Longispora sp. K20-0274 TaxID=3088255 RepID=UPI00399A8AB0